MKRLDIPFNESMIAEISSDFDLRTPNREALTKLVETFSGDYNPSIMNVLDMATGAGKTYLMAAFIEYLRRNGVYNVLIVTPGKIVQLKTVKNFTAGSSEYIRGSISAPDIVVPSDYSKWRERQNSAFNQPFGAFRQDTAPLLFIFNIHQLIAPRDLEGETKSNGYDAARRKPRKFDEESGVLFEYWQGLDDLVIIADESHLYGTAAKKFHAALKEISPAAMVGLTASPDKHDHIIFRYPLYKAIEDGFVKRPVLAFRKNGYTGNNTEEQQLRDAMSLRAYKQRYYDAYAKYVGKKDLKAVLFVVCSDVAHATEISNLLASSSYFGRADKVLQIDSKHDDNITQKRLEQLAQPHSNVLAVVSVNKLKEGWDVKNIAVMTTLRAMASEVLTQQTMGRGLRLPFGKITGEAHVDQLDIIAHQSFEEILKSENILEEFGLDDAFSDSPHQVRDQVERAVRAVENPERFHFLKDSGTTLEDGTSVHTNSVEEVPTAPATELIASIGSTIGLADVDTLIPSKTIEQDVLNPSLPSGFTDMAGTLEPDAITGMDVALGFRTVNRTEKFSDVFYDFPRTHIDRINSDVRLKHIKDEDVERSARKISRGTDVLHRRELIARLSKGIIDSRKIEQAEIDSFCVDDEAVQKILVKAIIDTQHLTNNQANKNYAEQRLVPEYMEYSDIAPGEWTGKALSSAVYALQHLVMDFVKTELSKGHKEAKIYPYRMPNQNGYSLAPNENIYPQELVQSSEEWSKKRFYGGWQKCLFEAAKFDAYATEFMMAQEILELSPDIVWWDRLQGHDEVYIHYTEVNKYYPDFVVRDTSGVNWIVETKGIDSAEVQAKREAAELVVRSLAELDEYTNQKWGYLLVFQEHIKEAESWKDLIQLSKGGIVS